MKDEESIDLRLSHDEALVLFEFLARFDQNESLCIEDEAERVVLANVLCILEKKLVAPFNANYKNLLESARKSLRSLA